MHSETKRCDILETLSTGGPHDYRLMLDILVAHAFNRGCKSTRWPLAEHDPNTQLAQALGFEKKWGFDMLIRPSDSSFTLPPFDKLRAGSSSLKNWRYAAIDYI